MLELISEISLVQWAFILLGLFIAIPPVLESLKGVTNSNHVNKNKVSKLSDLVNQWESLYDSCKEEGLDEAVTELEEVFPRLRGTKDPKK